MAPLHREGESVDLRELMIAAPIEPKSSSTNSGGVKNWRRSEGVLLTVLTSPKAAE